ncbi:MAG: 50S ribosomal protein L15 [Candidatus Gracilibacteria bacterium]|jgi:large subunit ribosomal protein L15
MKLNNLKPAQKKKAKMRVGRGNGSGKGTFCGRGGKGQSARAGGTLRRGFMGGQTPLIRQMPKLKGFTNPNKIRYQVVNVFQLEVFKDGSKVDKEALKKQKLIQNIEKPVKILSQGELTKKLTVIVENASLGAIKKIEKTGGKVEHQGNIKKNRKIALAKKKEEKKSANKAKRAKKSKK